MTNKKRENILFILKSVIFLYVFALFFRDFISTIKFFMFLFCEVSQYSVLPVLSYFIISKLLIYLYIVSLYFTAKKLGLIKFIDKSPIWLVVTILIIYEIILTLDLPTDITNPKLYQYIIPDTLRNFKHGYGFIGTFVAYKSARFLVNKYPKLSWLKKFYFLKGLEDKITFKNTYGLIIKLYNFLIKKPFLGFIKWWKENYRPW